MIERCQFHLTRAKKPKKLYPQRVWAQRDMDLLSLGYPDKVFRIVECQNYNGWHLTTAPELPEQVRTHHQKLRAAKRRRWRQNRARKKREQE